MATGPSGVIFPEAIVPEGAIRDTKQKVVGELVENIEQNFKEFNVSEIIRAGSLGHGTAVPENFDVDLVVYSRDIKPDELKKRGFRPWLKQLNQFLKTKLRPGLKTKMTSRSVQFVYNEIDVDLLVSPYWENQDEFYDFLKGIRGRKEKKRRNRYTVCASKWQVSFFKQQPNEVKEDCKRAKAWRNIMWPKGQGGEGRPSSYLMSLLVVAAYKRKTEDQTVTESLIQLVENSEGRNLDIYWADGPNDLYIRREQARLLPRRPRIVDPANPANNVWVTGIRSYRAGERLSNYEPGDGNCTLLKRYIDTLDLSKPVKYWLKQQEDSTE